MKEKLALLIELQKTELEAGRLLNKKRDLPERISALEAEFKAYCDVVEGERERSEELKKRRRDKDVQLKAGQDTLKRTRERLFEVKTNKEYQSMLKEIESSETKNSRMEDEIISILDESDRLEVVVKQKDEELATYRLRFEEQQKSLEEELNSLAGEFAVSSEAIEDLKKNIPADLLRKYEQIKGVSRGVAVVSVWKEICDGCHMFIPPQLYNQLQKSSDLTTCPNCNRIIYWENRNG